MGKRPGRWLSCLALAGGLLMAPALPSAVTPALAAERSFTGWLNDFRHDATAAGISEATLNRALEPARFLPRVIQLDRRQPESTLTFTRYLAQAASPARVARGRELMARHADVLAAVGRRYGVQPAYIVALWGIESDFGRHTGGFAVIDALATLAYDGRRSGYFRKELLAALQIMDRHGFGRQQLRGSWAGALGQCQFMPSSYLRYAVPFSGKGGADIWRKPADVFASTAHYLATVGWNGDQGWGRAVLLPAGFDPAAAGLDKRRPVAQWAAAGVMPAGGGHDWPAAGPGRDRQASLILPAGRGGPAYLVYDNYRTIMDWNRSTYFATTVGILADRIGAKAQTP